MLGTLNKTIFFYSELGTILYRDKEKSSVRTFCGLEKEAAKYSRKRNIILGILYNVYFLPKLCNDIGLTLHSAICTDNGGYKLDRTLHK